MAARIKTTRFSDVVDKAGAPIAYTLWKLPSKDRKFQAALNQARVMTIHQANVGTRKDYGTVGYKKEPASMLLIFPKSLKRFEGKRIVGIRYEKLEKT